jgi:signal transduction histidine kinase/ligand-binding sensor domain-containing protein
MLLVVAAAGSANAQINVTTIRFDHLGVEDGLADRDVNTIVQDDLGFIWIGTDDGISRYDGHDFTSLLYDPDDPNSLHDTTIREIALGANGVLWIATYSGIERLDPLTGRFTAYGAGSVLADRLPTDEYNEVLEDRNGFVWAGSDKSGLFRLDPTTGAIEHYPANPVDPGSLVDNTINEIFEARDGTVWVATGAYGVHRYDPGSNSFVRVPVPAPGIHPADGFYAITEDADGILWLAGWGLHRLDPISGESARMLPFPDVPEPVPPHYDNYVSSLAWSPDGRLWVGSYDRGLLLFDPATASFSNYSVDKSDTSSLRDSEVRELLRDRSGVLWIGLGNVGLSRLDPRRENVARLSAPEQSNLSALVEDDADNLWFGYSSAIVRWDPATGRGKTYTQGVGRGGLLNSHVTEFTRIASDPGAVWAGTADGSLNRIDVRGTVTARYPLVENPEFESHPIFEMVEMTTQPGVIWTAVWYGGLCRLFAATGATRCFSPDSSELAHYPRHMTEDKWQPGILWLATDEGLQRFDTQTQTFTDLYRHVDGDTTTISINLANRVASSRRDDGVLWVGLWSGGLTRFDTRTGTATRRYNVSNSELPHNTVTGITEDAGGILWVSTPRGVIRLDPADGRMRNVTGAIGVPLLPTGGFLANNGDVVLGAGGEAVYRFDPARVNSNSIPPEVVLTDLYVRDNRIEPGPGSLIDRPLTRGPEIALPYADRDVAFEYVALEYLQPDGVRYAYRLLGYDDAWREVGDQRRAAYTNLPPGRYTLQVRAANADGVWNEIGASADFTILPPWWRTLWAYFAYGLVALAAVLGVDRVQRRRVVAKERERSREKELAQAREIERAYAELRVAKDRLVHQEKLASLGQLTAGIGHEIKNPLNFVNNFAEVSAELAAELREVADRDSNAKLSDVADVVRDLEQNSLLIKEHGMRADSIVRSMMEHASNTSGRRQPTDINKLVDEHVDLAYHGRRSQVPDFSIEIRKDFSPDAGTVDVVPQEIGRVVLNLVGNAMDALIGSTESKDPGVTISTRRADGHVTISVTDNGPGIPPEDLDRIFEPFFTTKPAGTGTGLGLSLSHDIVAQGHGGTLAVTNGNGTGTTFTVSLPV